jgi:Bacterial PH domain
VSSGSVRPGPAVRPKGAAPGGREVFRLAPPVIFWWIWVAFAVANLADFAIQGAPSARYTAVITAVLATVTGLVYVLALRPKVIADETGITVVNPFRDHQIPWRLIQTVDMGDWVRVHYAPADGDAPADGPPGAAGPPGGKVRSSASAKTVYCWALYVSARTKRRSGRVPTPPRRTGLFRTPAGLDAGPGRAGQTRLPEEAKYLAALPVTKAIAVRLDTRAAKERARASQAGAADATARWAWPAIAAIVVPALALLIIVLS